MLKCPKIHLAPVGPSCLDSSLWLGRQDTGSNRFDAEQKVSKFFSLLT